LLFALGVETRRAVEGLGGFFFFLCCTLSALASDAAQPNGNATSAPWRALAQTFSLGRPP